MNRVVLGEVVWAIAHHFDPRPLFLCLKYSEYSTKISRLRPGGQETRMSRASHPQDTTCQLSDPPILERNDEMWCRTVWEGLDAQVVVREVLELADADAWVAWLKLWESEPDDPGAPWVDYCLFDTAGRKRVIWRRR